MLFVCHKRCNHVIHNVDARSIPLYPSFGQCPGSWFLPDDTQYQRHQLLHHKHSHRETLWGATHTNQPLSHFCQGLHWCRSPPRRRCFSANSLTARIFTIGSPYHKGLRTRPANGLYLQSPKLLERIDAISSHYTPSNAPGTKSLTYDCLYNRFLVCRLFPAQYL